jgi:DNA-binding YbaB/EbfC family protein
MEVNMGINPLEMMKNIQRLQSEMEKVQEKLSAIVVTGAAGGGLVELDVTGRLEVQDVRISKEVANPDDVEMLEDLVLAAFSDAQDKAKVAAQNEIKSHAANMGLPAGMLPKDLSSLF